MFDSLLLLADLQVHTSRFLVLFALEIISTFSDDPYFVEHHSDLFASLADKARQNYSSSIEHNTFSVDTPLDNFIYKHLEAIVQERMLYQKAQRSMYFD